MTQLLDLLTAQSFALLVSLIKRLANDLLDIYKTLNALSHAQAEVSEPLMIESNCPVLTEELDSVGNNAVLVAVCQLVEVILMKSNETPETL